MPGEQRCTDLGTNCLCSAPFNNNDFPNFTVVANGSEQTFSDDYDANGGECSRLEGFVWTVRTPVMPFSTPANYSGRVLQYYNATGAMNHSPVDWGDDICGTVPNARRVCFRVYKGMSPDASHATSESGPPDNEIKFMESQTFQGNSGPGFDGIFFRMVDANCDDAATPGPNVASMRNELVRWEFCFSAPSGHLCDDDTGLIDLYIRTKLVMTGTEASAQITGCSDSGRGEGFEGRYIDKIQINGLDNTNTASDEWSVLSHYMVAAWDTTDGANGPWIGAASEIEGEDGGGGGGLLKKLGAHFMIGRSAL